MAVPETRALLSKEAFSWTIFRFLRMRNHRAPSVTIAMNTSPPTTPPAIAPALDFDLLADAVGVRVGVKTLVLVIIADEADAEAADAAADAEASDDQGISFHCSHLNLLRLTLLSSYCAKVIACL